MTKLEEIFRNPPDAYRGTDFWMLNDELQEDELRRQLRTLRKQGIASVIARTYVGLRSDYPGTDWMSKMRVLVDEAKQLGMTIFMQAGYMPEAVLGLPEEYSLGDVRPSPSGTGEGVLLDSFDGVDYRLYPSLTILDMLSPKACEFYVKQSYEDMWSEFRSEYGKTIVSMWVDEPSYARVSLPWTAGLPDTYRTLWGEEFQMKQLHLLFTDGAGCRIFRLRYWRTVLHMIKNAYFKAVRDWGRANNIRFSGHLMAEDTMEQQIHATCFTMPLYKYFDIPGIDYLTAEMNWRHSEIKPEKPFDNRWKHYAAYTTPLQCSSAAHQNGQKVVLAEMYGVSTENLNLRDQKHMFDHFASLGINHRSVHGIFYSLRGRSKRAYPPHINDYQPYFAKYHLLTDALARETVFVRAGEPVCDILLLHPMETAFSLYHAKSKNNVQENELLHRADDGFNQLIRGLVSTQTSFELGDEDTIAEYGSVSAEGRFVVGRMAYTTVVLPNMEFIRESTRLLLLAFIEHGGRVIIYGQTPSFTDEGTACSLPGTLHAGSLRELHEMLTTANVSYRFEKQNDDTGVQIFCCRDGDNLLFFLTNADCARVASGTLLVPGVYRAERFCVRDGSVHPFATHLTGGESAIPVKLPEGGTLLLRLLLGKPQENLPVKPETVLPLNVQWRVRREEPNVLVLEFFRFARGNEPMSEKAYPILAIQELLSAEDYHGPITLCTSFHLAKPLRGLRLAVERPVEQAIEIDGVPVDNHPIGQYRCFAFETLALPSLMAGTHALIIRRNFAPLRKPNSSVTSLFENLGGVELEAVMVLGDFAVNSVVEPCVSKSIRLCEDFILEEETETVSEELVTRGYPFYCGVMTMECEFTLPSKAEASRLVLDGLNTGAAEVFVNGTRCGDLCWPPYEVTLTGVHEGKNTLKLRLFGTLRNLLGPWHRQVGEIGACWAGYDAPNLPWTGRFAHENGCSYPDWFLDRKPDRPGWTESYLFAPFGISDAKIIFHFE